MKSLLYIDDNSGDGERCLHDFEDTDTHVDYVESGMQAFEQMLQRSYDLIVCDLMMPKQNGVGFAKELTEKKIGIPLLFTSGVELLQDFGDYDCPANYLGFISKPVTPEKIQPFLEAA